jgi:hypothetical protein
MGRRMIVFVLAVLVVNQPWIGPINVDSTEILYKNEKDCRKRLISLKEELKKNYTGVYVQCRERIIR